MSVHVCEWGRGECRYPQSKLTNIKKICFPNWLNEKPKHIPWILPNKSNFYWFLFYWFQVSSLAHLKISWKVYDHHQDGRNLLKIFTTLHQYIKASVEMKKGSGMTLLVIHLQCKYFSPSCNTQQIAHLLFIVSGFHFCQTQIGRKLK